MAKKHKRLRDAPPPAAGQTLLAKDTAGNDVPTPAVGIERSPPYGLKDITRGYLVENMLAWTDDYILMQQGGNDLRTYTEILRDEQVKACFEQRRSAVVSAELIVEPGGKRAIDTAAADFLKTQLDKIGFNGVTDKMLHCVFYGFSVAEVQYEAGEKYLEWKSIKARNPRRFGFKPNGELRLRTLDTGILGEAAPPPYFWTISYGTEYDDQPYGKGLAHWLYWLVKFKRNTVKYWMIYVEKFGTPTTVGTFKTGTEQNDIDNLLAACGAVSTDSAVVIPDSMKLELLEAKRAGSADYDKLMQRWDDAIAKAIIGQTLTAERNGTKGQSQVHYQVRQDIVQTDADLICDAFSAGPVAWLIALNFPNAALPRVRRVIEEPEDLNVLSERDQRLVSVGYRPTQKRINEVYGDGYEPIPPDQMSAAADKATAAINAKQSQGIPGASVNSSGSAKG